MDEPASWLLPAFVVCLLLSGFFSSAESAFISVPRLRVRYLTESGDRLAEQLQRVLDRPERFLATVLLGNNLVNIGAATIGTMLCVAWFGLPWGPVIATAGVTAIVLMFGELLPKTIGVHYAERMAMSYVYPIRAVELLLFPVVMVLDRIGIGFRRLVTDAENKKMMLSAGELRSAIDVGESEGVVAEDQAEMLHKVLEFTNTPVSKVMVPRTEIAWVVEGTKLSDFLSIYADKPYSRFPVYRDTTDNVIGILSAKDVLMKLTQSCAPEQVLVDELIRPAHFVPESQPLGRLLTEMRDEGHHVALVVDEYGGVEGMVTLGLLTEEVVGDIKDELGNEDEDFVMTGTNTYEIDGGYRVEDANEELELGLPMGDYETVAGFVLSYLGHIPHEGEQLKYGGLQLVIAEVRGIKIEKIVVTRDTPIAATHTELGTDRDAATSP
ncbi:MAG: HlyC/CorC family transporter [Dehalococcoidia bacterium]|nr:HlyC/CorC family transporter [Dehalococcoidia bacterium]